MAIDVEVFAHGEMELLGQLVAASNATLLVEINGVKAVYKPIAGEAPLWDFPEHTLGLREVAAYQFSELLGWGIVPLTILRDGLFGVGAVQRWIDIDDDVDLISLAQSNNPRLGQIALFDALINNTDRKVSHLLPSNGEVYGCDHGVTFHVEDKLRTVLWQWRGQQVPDQWLADLRRLDVNEVKRVLQPFLSPAEIKALLMRIQRMCDHGTYPQPNPEWPAVPWPPI